MLLSKESENASLSYHAKLENNTQALVIWKRLRLT